MDMLIDIDPWKIGKDYNLKQINQMVTTLNNTKRTINA